MGVVIHEFEVSPTSQPAPAAAPAAPDGGAASPAPRPRPADAQQLTVERRERALRLFAH